MHLTRSERAALVASVAETIVSSLRLSLDPDDIGPDTPLFGAGLRLDSLDSVELVVAIEARFGVELVPRQGSHPGILRSLNTIADRLVVQGVR
jgi:acyl carrier protein